MNELVTAAKEGNSAKVKKILEAGVTVEEEGLGTAEDVISLALYHATMQGHKNSAKLLIEHGGDLATGLYTAAGKGWLDIVQLLLDKGANANPEDALPLTWAARGGHLEVVKLLVQHGANVNGANDPKGVIPNRKGQPIVGASAGGHFAVVEFLIQKGADVNPPAASPLIVAQQKRKKDIAELLEKHGAIPVHAS